MPPLTVDIALRLPDSLHEQAIAVSFLLAERMNELGHPSVFRLGQPISADDGICHPHVSLFMLRLDADEISPLLSAIDALAAGLPAVPAQGQQWRHNPQGAPELHFHQSQDWIALQRNVVGAAEPLRRGRLRATDPAGTRLADLVEQLQQENPDGHRLRQLTRYGYDEIADDQAVRFSPHITLAWPKDDFAVPLTGLPPAPSWHGSLGELAVFGMGPNGTCTNLFGSFSLGQTTADIRG
jgi:hypothetical protein